MSHQHIELHRRLNEAFNARDPEALVEICDPAVEVHSVFAAIGGAVYHRHDGVRAWIGDIIEAWKSFNVTVEALHDLGDRTLALVVLDGQGTVSGANVLMPYAQVIRWRDNRCVWFKAYAHRKDAFHDLGVSPNAVRDQER